MTSTVRALSLALLATLAACAGSRPRPPENVPVLPPSLIFRSASVTGASFEGVTVDVAFEIENPNAFALPVVRLSHAVSVDGVPAFSGNAAAHAAVPSRGIYPVTVPVFLPYGRIPAIGERVAAGRPVEYQVSGAVGVQTPAGIMDLPIGWQGVMPVPRLPVFTFEGVDVGALSMLGLSFDVKLRVVNPNAFPLPGGHLGHRLAVAGTPVASGDQRLPQVAPGGTALFSIPAQVNPVGAGAGALRAVVTALQGAEVPVGLEGQASVAGIPFGLRLESRIARR
ncbi:MAG TPA: LEA type 2 family protein [Anaeromyxobacteraceae bacterium]|nr:LEA type 2 family protein [Anaeromyxobacteraceae bacterium]